MTEVKRKKGSEALTLEGVAPVEAGLFAVETILDIVFLVPMVWSVGEGAFVDSHDSVRIVDVQKELRARLAFDLEKWLKTNESVRNRYLSASAFLAAPSPPPIVRTPLRLFGEYVGSVAALLGGIPVELNCAATGTSADAAATEQLLEMMSLFAPRERLSIGKYSKEPAHGPFGDMHHAWLGRDVPGDFRRLLGQIAEDEAQMEFCDALWMAAERIPFGGKGSGKPAKKSGSAALGSASSVDSAAPVRVCVWIRRVKVADGGDPKDMSDALLQAVLEELTVTAVAHKIAAPLEVILLGDPVHKVSELLGILTAACKTTGCLGGTLVDFRGFISTSIDKSKPFAKFYSGAKVPTAFKRPVLSATPSDESAPSASAGAGDSGDEEEKTVSSSGGSSEEKGEGSLVLVPEKNWLTHLNRWVFFHYLCKTKDLKFVTGTEAGNMDALGYAGTPIISLENADRSPATPFSVLTDRIGEYGLASPLWQVVNWGEGESPDLFRAYLRGAMLRYFRTKAGKDAGAPSSGYVPTSVASAAIPQAQLVMDTDGAANALAAGAVDGAERARVAKLRFTAWLSARRLVEGAATGAGQNCGAHCLFQFGDASGSRRGRQPVGFSAIRAQYNYGAVGTAIDVHQLNQQAVDQGLSIHVFTVDTETGGVTPGGHLGLDPATDGVIKCSMLHIDGNEGGHYEPLWPA